MISPVRSLMSLLAFCSAATAQTFVPAAGPLSGSGSNNLGGFNVAAVVSPSALLASGSPSRFTFKSSSSGVTVDSCFASQDPSATLPGVNSSVRITFGGANGFTRSGAATVVSDAIALAIDQTKTLVVRCHVNAASPFYLVETPAGTAGWTSYHKIAADESGSTGAPSGWTLDGRIWGLTLVEVDTGGSPPPPPPPPPSNPGEPIDIYVLWGQSHRVGWAPIQDQSAYLHRARVKTFDPGAGAWVQAVDPLSYGVGPFEAGLMGSGLPFGDEMARLRPHRIAGVIVCAHGATSISQWAPGSALHSGCVSRVQAALAAAPAGSKVAGMSSWQGESDNGSPSGWDTARLAIAAAFRTALSTPDLPDNIVVVDTRWTGIRAAQLGMTLPKNTSRIDPTIDQAVPSSGDFNDPKVYRAVGPKEARALAAQIAGF